MVEGVDELAQSWRACIENDPSGTLGRVIADLAGCEERVRTALARRFVVMLCGPRVDPSRAAAVLAYADAERLRIPAMPGLRELRQRRAGLEAQLRDLEGAVATGSPDMAQAPRLEGEAARKREREVQLEALLREAEPESKEMAA